MSPSRVVFTLLVLVLPTVAGCPCRSYDRRYAAPTADEILASLAQRRDAVRSFRTSSTMDYWVGDDRFRGQVLVMGELGARVRMNALQPTEAVAADLACDGAGFVYVDHLHDCVLTGPCTQDSIAALLRVPLAPDDFLYLALGATPVVPGAAGTVRWDGREGREIVELTGEGGVRQTLVVDGRDGQRTWDLLRSEVRGADGTVLWTVDHKGYRTVEDAAGVAVRVPGKSNIRTPRDKSDLLVEWGDDLEVNVELPAAAWALEPPPLPVCGQR
jgi:hypothetical protein